MCQVLLPPAVIAPVHNDIAGVPTAAWHYFGRVVMHSGQAQCGPLSCLQGSPTVNDLTCMRGCSSPAGFKIAVMLVHPFHLLQLMPIELQTALMVQAHYVRSYSASTLAPTFDRFAAAYKEELRTGMKGCAPADCSSRHHQRH